MISVSQAIKNAYNQSTTQSDKIILNGTEYKINNVEYQDDTYYEGNIFGTAIARQLSFEIENCNIEKQEFQYLTGIEVNGVLQWINLGNFITQDVQDSDTTGMIKVEAMDYMLKTNIIYNSTLNYGDNTVTLYDVLEEACQLSGLTLGTLSITNGDFIVDSNQFEEGTLVRQVIQAVAQISGCVAKIKPNNSLYLINPNQVSSISKVYDLSDYKNIDIKRYTHPINTVVLGMADIEGENVVLRDETAVAQNGENRIVFNDNPFAYTEAKRTTLITPLFNAVNGFDYKAYEIEGQSHFYMETLDKVQFVDSENNTYDSYIFRFNYKSPNGLDSTTEAPSITSATVNYENIISAEEIAKRTEIIVDKQNQQITSVVSQTIDPDNPNSMSNKLSQVTQTVSELSSQISDIADITTSLESNSARLQFEDINQSEPVRVVIHPVGVNIAKLHPHTNLKPSINLVIKTRILRFENTTTNETFDYEIPDDLLYYDSENYDEFILDYESLSCVINKKCKWNNDGTVGLLPSERAVEYEFPHIELTEGDYMVSLIQYSNGYLFARMMIKNYYTAQFATRAELNSDIRQTVDNINLSVGERLTNYSTTTEMNSAIDIKANAITQSVSETYVTNQSLESNYSTTEQTSTMISNTVSSMTKDNIETVIVEYALGTSTTTAPTSGWSTTAPTWQQGKYMWQRTKTTTADGTESTSNPTCIAGAKGQDGTNGVSISSIAEYYAVSSSNSSAPADSVFKTTMQTMTETNRYLWNYEVMTYSNGTTQKTIKRVIGTYGNKGIDGTNGVGISSIVNKYQISTSNTTAPTSWSNTPQTMTATNKYLWNYEIITYSDNTTTTSTPAVIGVYGDKGQTGNTGKGVKGVVAEYYLSNSESTQSGGSWTTTQPTYKENHYYWTRTKITWTDDTVTYTTPILVQEINSLNKSVASLTIEAGEIKQRVDAIEDLTRTVDGTKTVTLTNCVKGSVLELHIYGNNSVFQAIYPTDTLYPQDNLYPKGDSLITVQYANNTTKTYELGVTEVLRKNGSVYDEYILESGQAKVIRRINSDGTVKTNPTTQNLREFSIALEEGTNTITIKNYSADMYVKYAIKSAYTDIFATQVQMNSSITQTAEEINLEVSKKVDSNEVISKINQSAEAVGINANKINLSANDVLNLLSGNTINLSGKSIKIASNNFSVNENGNMTCSNANITGGKFNVTGAGSATDLVRVRNSSDSSQFSYLQPIGAGFVNGDSRIDIFTAGQNEWGGTVCSIDIQDDDGGTYIRGARVTTPEVIQTSLESQKKNFEKYQNALDTIKNIDIYKYNLKSESDNSKKHIGFVIGDNYKYSEEVTSRENDGADIYSFVSLCCQAIKEQQEEIEKLRKEIKK